MDSTTLYSIIFLITSPFTGFILYKLTTDEKDLIKSYFPFLLLPTAILTIVFYFTELKYALITTYLFITLVIWHKFSQKITPSLKPVKNT